MGVSGLKPGVAVHARNSSGPAARRTMCQLNCLLPNGTPASFDLSSDDTMWMVYEQVYSKTYLKDNRRVTLFSIIDGASESVITEDRFDQTLAALKLVPTGTIRVTFK